MVYCLDDEAKAFIELYKDKEAYKQRKDQIVSDTVKILTERYPGLEGKLECIDVWTPATYCRYTGSEVGAWMGFILPAGEIPLQMSRRIKGLKNVYLGTQWQQNPGGLPMAILAGKNAVRAIPKK